MDMALGRCRVGANTVNAVLEANAAAAVSSHGFEILHTEAVAARNVSAARNTNTRDVGAILSRLVILVGAKLLLEGGTLTLYIAVHRSTVESGRAEIATEHVARHQRSVRKRAASSRRRAVEHGRRVGMKVHELHNISEHCGVR
jgi:hypothetical protein